ncbi:hypothetical protein D0T56_11600 [Dysgonomonas sp. 520]|nr:hypothetical protein [Dysgonomonas sp. 520]
MSTPLLGQTYYYKQVNIVYSNGQKVSGDGTGQFVTFSNKGCYDSNIEGYTVKNGFLEYKGIDDGIYVYYGTSYWGTCNYYFSSDKGRLNVKEQSTGNTYVYQRMTPPNGVKTSSKIKNIAPNPSPMPLPNPMPNPSPRPAPNRVQQCKGCRGSGLCSMCEGKGFWKKDGKIFSCSRCYGDGKCRVCYGKGVIK